MYGAPSVGGTVTTGTLILVLDVVESAVVVAVSVSVPVVAAVAVVAVSSVVAAALSFCADTVWNTARMTRKKNRTVILG